MYDLVHVEPLSYEEFQKEMKDYQDSPLYLAYIGDDNKMFCANVFYSSGFSFNQNRFIFKDNCADFEDTQSIFEMILVDGFYKSTCDDDKVDSPSYIIQLAGGSQVYIGEPVRSEYLN